MNGSTVGVGVQRQIVTAVTTEGKSPHLNDATLNSRNLHIDGGGSQVFQQ
jgi:hypothetical protein